jgi:hypothetical protein
MMTLLALAALALAEAVEHRTRLFSDFLLPRR